jgi:pyruvate formate lyase activating enzyme
MTRGEDPQSEEPAGAESLRIAQWWRPSDDAGGVVCELCPRGCSLGPGRRGFCFVRRNRDGRLVSTTYGRSTGFCIDPIEKKPLFHFYPGTPILSFGTAGCNLGCVFCQNWSTSKAKETDVAGEAASPEDIARTARQLDCRSVAFTYNDPIVWAEYAIDTARACRAEGLHTVAVTAGYIAAPARRAFFESIDAANVDLKGFSDDFYRTMAAGRLEPVCDTLRWLVHESDVWVEITNLLIPRANDSPDMLRAMCDWIARELRPEVPLHFSAFHPDYKLTDRESTPTATVELACQIARQAGLHYVYAGNIRDARRQSTFCAGCGKMLIQRDGYELGVYDVRGGGCLHCGATLPGRFDDAPGRWGSRRQPVRIRPSDIPFPTLPPPEKPR